MKEKKPLGKAFSFLILGCSLVPCLLAGEEIILQEGDVIKVLIEEYSSHPLMLPIDSAGLIILPLVGRMKAAGLSLSELEEKIATEVGKYLRDSKVIVTLAETMSNKIFLLGAVKKPGLYPFAPERGLIKTLLAAGGPASNANLKKVKIIRGLKGNSEVIKVNLEKFFHTGQVSYLPHLQEEDIIIVPAKPTQSWWRKMMTFMTDFFVIYNLLVILGVISKEGIK